MTSVTVISFAKRLVSYNINIPDVPECRKNEVACHIAEAIYGYDRFYAAVCKPNNTPQIVDSKTRELAQLRANQENQPCFITSHEGELIITCTIGTQSDIVNVVLPE